MANGFLTREQLIKEGGKGSGNFDHAGRPGQRGGSKPKNRLVADIISEFEREFEVPPGRIKIVLARRSSRLENLPVACLYDPGNDVIYVYKDAPSDRETLRGVLAHEYTHMRMSKLSNSDLADVIRSVAGKDAWSNHAWRAMKETGSFTSYSAYLWKSKDVGGLQAFKETVCEVSRMKSLGRLDDVPEDWRAVYTGILLTGEK